MSHISVLVQSILLALLMLGVLVNLRRLISHARTLEKRQFIAAAKLAELHKHRAALNEFAGVLKFGVYLIGLLAIAAWLGLWVLAVGVPAALALQHWGTYAVYASTLPKLTAV